MGAVSWLPELVAVVSVDDDLFWQRVAEGTAVWPPAGSAEREAREIELAARRCAARGHEPAYNTVADDRVVAAVCACGGSRFVLEERAEMGEVDVSRCCWLPGTDIPGAPAECVPGEVFRLQTGPGLEDYTEACRAHLGWLVDSQATHSDNPGSWSETLVTVA